MGRNGHTHVNKKKNRAEIPIDSGAGTPGPFPVPETGVAASTRCSRGPRPISMRFGPGDTCVFGCGVRFARGSLRRFGDCGFPETIRAGRKLRQNVRLGRRRMTH